MHSFLFGLSPKSGKGREWDSRHKLVALPMVGAALLAAPPEYLVIPLALLIVGYRIAEVGFSRAVVRARWFLFLIALLATTRGIEVHAITPLRVSIAPGAAAAGALLGARILTVALTAHLYLSTTPRGETVRAAEWLLRPLFGRRLASDTALMVGLSMSMVPEVLRAVRSSNRALTARGFPAGTGMRARGGAHSGAEAVTRADSGAGTGPATNGASVRERWSFRLGFRRTFRRAAILGRVATRFLLREANNRAFALAARGYTGRNRRLVFPTYRRRLSVSVPPLVVLLLMMALR